MFPHGLGKKSIVQFQFQPPFTLKLLAETAGFSPETWGGKGPGQVCVPSCCPVP